jgi:hypothetical protein
MVLDNLDWLERMLDWLEKNAGLVRVDAGYLADIWGVTVPI